MTTESYRVMRERYRESRHAALWGNAPADDSAALAEKLRDFCIIGGQDLAELEGFLREVDQELIAYGGG